ncbi:MAG: hypothetical protein K8S16_01565 [Bacteroidales bacterium]|nr:hypothetical protein [Bacteroidales bacterium]
MLETTQTIYIGDLRTEGTHVRSGNKIIELTFPKNNYSDKEKKIIEKAAFTCPVFLSLHTDLKNPITLHY